MGSATGGRYNPATNLWTALPTANAPGGRYRHRAVWTGAKMVVWGGQTSVAFANGGVYEPWAGALMTFSEWGGWQDSGPWFWRHYEFGAYRPIMYLRSLGFVEAGAVLGGEPVIYSPALGWLSIRGAVDGYVILWSYQEGRFLVIERGLGLDVWRK